MQYYSPLTVADKTRLPFLGRVMSISRVPPQCVSLPFGMSPPVFLFPIVISPFVFERMSESSGLKRFQQKFSNCFYKIRKIYTEIFKTIPVYECFPLIVFIRAIGEFITQRKRYLFRNRSSSPFECCLDRLNKSIAIKRKCLSQNENVVEIFHSTVSHSQEHHRLQFLCNLSLFGISSDLRSRILKQYRIANDICVWRYSIAETDVDLDSDFGIAEYYIYFHPLSRVFLIFTNLFYVNAVGIEFQSILLDLCPTYLTNYCSENFRFGLSKAKQIKITSRSMHFTYPNSHQHCTFENESIGVFGFGQPIQESFYRISCQD